MALPLHFAQSDPDRPAVIQDGAVLTFAELNRMACQVANLLRAHDIAMGDHVALCLENRFDFFGVVFGAHYAGTYYTAISPHLTADEVAYIIENCNARVVIGSERTIPLMAEARQASKAVEAWYTVDDAMEGYESLHTALATQPATVPPDAAEGRDMLYSSGSTGRPKGVLAPLPTQAFGEENDGATALFNRNGIDGDTVYLNPAPLYHAAPLRWSLCAIRRGGTVINMGRFDAETCLDLIAHHRVTHIQFVPTMMIRLLKLPEDVRAAADLSSVQKVVHAAAPCPVDIKHQFIDWFGPVVDEYYGGTEANGLTYITAGEWLANPGSVGRSAVGVIHIMDDDGHDCANGTPGKIYFSGGNAFEYHGEPEKTASAYRGDRSSLGDIGYVNDGGYLFLTDRDVNLIISAGTNIYPQMTEDVLVQYPEVTDAAAIGVPNADFGEVILAVIEPSGPVDPQALTERLRAHAARHLPTIRQPKHYDIVDAMPRHPNGKLRKVAMRDAYRARMEAGETFL